MLPRQGQPEAAEVLYRKALSIAEGARLWELRATVSLARLRRDQDRHSEARLLGGGLRLVHRGFRFDTPDLRQAKALLDILDGP